MWARRGYARRRDEVTPPQDDSPPGPERLLALSDGVVAIALTPLILDLKVLTADVLRHPDSAPGLAAHGHRA